MHTTARGPVQQQAEGENRASELLPQENFSEQNWQIGHDPEGYEPEHSENRPSDPLPWMVQFFMSGNTGELPS